MYIMEGDLIMRNIILYFGLATLLMFSYQNCSNPEIAFKTLSSTDPNQTLEIPVEPGKSLITENLGIKTTSRNIDFVWIIDNSGSMNQEAAHVNQNYKAFMTEISSRAEIKSVLISRSGTTSTAVNMPSSLDPKNHKQFNITVNSNDPMSFATGALISKAECNNNVSRYYKDSSKCNRYSETTDTKSFLRVNSKKIFVFVTDDEENYTSPGQFLNAFDYAFPGQSPLVYSFIGLSPSNNCYSRIGDKYDELSMQTNGGVFDVCQKDWTTHFTDMINHVFVSTENMFNIKNEVYEEVVEVRIDDTTLTKDQYKVENSTIIINPNLLSENSKRVTIKYTVLK